MHTQWWFWTGIGAVVATAVVVGVVLGTQDGGTEAPIQGPDGVYEVLRETP